MNPRVVAGNAEEEEEEKEEEEEEEEEEEIHMTCCAHQKHCQPQLSLIASLVKWIRCAPRERQTRGSNPTCAGGGGGGFPRVESYQLLKDWYSSGNTSRCLALKGQRWDRSVRCQYSVTM